MKLPALIATLCVATALHAASARPNILFIALDDLNDWTGCLGGHPQARTPNIDRLAASGTLFNNAHCAAPSCNPSRTALFTGIAPWHSGVTDNRHKMRHLLPDAELLPRLLSRHGYWSAGSGKMLHYFIDAQSWDEYYPEKTKEDPFPPNIPWGPRPKSLPRAGEWQYVETDWASFDVDDEKFGGDYLVTQWIGEQLSRAHDKPFFLACGIYRPHEPWFVPKKYFDLFPLDQIQLPPGYKADDLDDLSAPAKAIAKNRYFEHIQAHNQWRPAIQAYLASIAYADAMVGRALDALEKSPHRDNTIVVLWSDHGWHLGEKEHWQKYTGWRACTRVPLIIRLPGQIPALCTRPVSLLSLAPTLVELCGLPAQTAHDGPSLVPLLKNPLAEWPHAALTQLSRLGNHALSSDDWRYLHYHDGTEELYHIAKDPHEWDNLAHLAEHAEKLRTLRDQASQLLKNAVPPATHQTPPPATKPKA